MMEDALEMGLDTGEVGADADTIYSKICDEIGVDYQNENQVSNGALGIHSGEIGAGALGAGKM